MVYEKTVDKEIDEYYNQLIPQLYKLFFILFFLDLQPKHTKHIFPKAEGGGTEPGKRNLIQSQLNILLEKRTGNGSS